jgi:hypothetical protein
MHVQGNGIYLSPEGEKYIGAWAGGRKHGRNLYFLPCHTTVRCSVCRISRNS